MAERFLTNLAFSAILEVRNSVTTCSFTTSPDGDDTDLEELTHAVSAIPGRPPGEKLMHPLFVDQLLRLLFPVALILLALHAGAHVTGFGKGVVKRLTARVVQGFLAIAFLWMLFAAICASLTR